MKLGQYVAFQVERENSIGNNTPPWIKWSNHGQVESDCINDTLFKE